MAGSFLLDTSVVVDLFRNGTAVEQRTRDATVIYVASIALGELYYGARKSRQAAQGVIYVDQFATRNIVLDCDIETARRFGIIKRQLQDKGRPIPDNDIWIAAVALQHGLTLATRDAHFRAVENLTYEIW
jgi:tRNA(fMet)-specific endonuclease VapC